MKVELNALTVGPDEVLIITVPADAAWDETSTNDLLEYLVEVGLKDRALVIQGDVTLSKVKK